MSRQLRALESRIIAYTNSLNHEGALFSKNNPDAPHAFLLLWANALHDSKTVALLITRYREMSPDTDREQPRADEEIVGHAQNYIGDKIDDFGIILSNANVSVEWVETILTETDELLKILDLEEKDPANYFENKYLETLWWMLSSVRQDCQIFLNGYAAAQKNNIRS